MRQEMIHRPIRKRGIGVLAALAAAATVVAAGPAQARNEFQNGFEDQLGRIAAFGAVNLGLSILTGGYYPAAVVPVPVAPVVHYAPPVYYAPPPPVYYAPAVYRPVYPAYYGPRNVVVVKHKPGHAKHHRKDYGYGRHR